MTEMSRPPLPVDGAALASIALCTYNGGRFLRAQLDSLLGQDYPSLEIVAVDDGSTDGSWEILEEYARRDARLRIHRNPDNLGFIGNFERAMSLCRGEYIALSDQDDIWDPRKLSILVARIGSHSAIYSDAELIDEHGHALGMRSSSRMYMYRGADPAAFVFFNCVSGHAMMIRRELLAAALPFPRIRFHDWWLAFVAASFGGVEYVDQPLVQFRQHEAARTDMAKRKKKAKKDRIEVFEERAQWLRELARVPSPHQGYFLAFFRSWVGLASHRYVSLLLLWLMWRRRQALFFIDRTIRPIWFKTLVEHVQGFPLRQRRDPVHYPRLPSNLPTL
ncbi:MAG TPA: glycosyltransferase family 2 protein [Solimonas sp.]|nr:glycosyltransferase family 2 protein [Solimonas sp.]